MKKPQFSFDVPVKVGRKAACHTIIGHYGQMIQIVGMTDGKFKWLCGTLDTAEQMRPYYEASEDAKSGDSI
jgi:hypothetical protein